MLFHQQEPSCTRTGWACCPSRPPRGFCEHTRHPALSTRFACRGFVRGTCAAGQLAPSDALSQNRQQSCTPLLRIQSPTILRISLRKNAEPVSGGKAQTIDRAFRIDQRPRRRNRNRAISGSRNPARRKCASSVSRKSPVHETAPFPEIRLLQFADSSTPAK